MISRAIYKRRTGRKALTALAVLGLLAGSLLVGTSALAVNQTGAFELDGNAINGAPAGDDADNVCYQVAIDGGATAAAAHTKCTASAGTNGATATTWVDATSSLEI